MPRMGLYDAESQGCGVNWDDLSPGVRRFIELCAMVLLPLLPAGLLVISSFVLLSQNVKSYTKAHEAYEAFNSLKSFGDVMGNLQREMEGVSTLLATNGSEIMGERNEFYDRTDHSIGLLPPFPPGSPSEDDLLETLDEHRFYQAFLNTSVLGEIEFYTNLVSTLVDCSTYMIQQNVPRNYWKKVVVYHSLCLAYIDFGVEKALGIVYFFAGLLSQKQYSSFISAFQTGMAHLETSQQFDPKHSDEIQVIINMLNESVHSLRMAMDVGHSQGEWMDGVIWNRRYSNSMKKLVELLASNMQYVKEELQEMISSSVTSIVFHLLVIFVIFVLFSPFILISAKRAIHTLSVYTQTMDRKSRELQREKRRTERLIREMLPTSIAYRMVKGSSVEAEYFDSVTVFFSDIADFNDISMNSSPYDIVSFLNDIYNLIDARLERFDVYKVETISCVYMVVSGMPMRNGMRHASEIAKLALDIMEVTASLSVPHMPDRGLLLRIGADTGPVVGGVVGNKMPRYCLFGDTVNTASRMQSNGEARRIHVSESTMRVLMATGGFVLSERGQVDIKGKGTMTTYWLDGRDTAQAKSEGSLSIFERTRAKLALLNPSTDSGLDFNDS